MISEQFAKYQCGAIHAAGIRDGKVTDRAICSAESEIHLPKNTVSTREYYIGFILQLSFSKSGGVRKRLHIYPLCGIV